MDKQEEKSEKQAETPKTVSIEEYNKLLAANQELQRRLSNSVDVISTLVDKLITK
jgi:hypothetical protein